MMKENPAAIPVPKQKALVINEASQTRLSEERPVIVNTGVNVGSSKGKEVLVAERPMKRMRTQMPVQKKSGAEEISRVEFDGDEILNLDSGDALILPPSEHSAEDVQEEIRSFIPQTLKLANVVTVQIGKMAMRIKELEAENAKAKEVVMELTTALQERASVAPESSAENARQFQELKEDLKGHKSLILTLRKQLLTEKNFSDGLRRDVIRLESQIHGEPSLEQTPEVRLERLLSEMERVAEVYGTDCDLYRTKQQRLDRMLTAPAEDGERGAAEEAKLAAKDDS